MTTTNDADIEIKILDVDQATASNMATELGEHLRSNESAIRTVRLRDDATHQDSGAILGVILGSAAAHAVIEGIFSWLQLRRRAKVRLKRVLPDGESFEFEFEGNLSTRERREILDRIGHDTE
ncbi:effector-associated constant component EACC1 [Micromonospora sp. LOL_015]|uniref:effector-associated constant component EACC1 n=1 Tax=Micromonospora sp. LOL_015 TaxID=3345416 RepID=UPI003A858C36